MDWYAIRLKGHLAGNALAQFEGLATTLLPTGETLLIGQVPDQAALHGILRRIYDLGLTLVLVQQTTLADSAQHLPGGPSQAS